MELDLNLSHSWGLKYSQRHFWREGRSGGIVSWDSYSGCVSSVNRGSKRRQKDGVSQAARSRTDQNKISLNRDDDAAFQGERGLLLANDSKI